MIPNPPQLIGFSVTEGNYLNVFLAGGFAGQIPLLAIPGGSGTYVQPDGVSQYFQPDGVSLYLVP